MPHAISMPTPGLQALILCGPGSSFPTFTSNPDENPKALLPVANRPMVWYPIDFCYRMGISNITLICPPSAAGAMTTALNTNPFLTSLPLPRPDLLAPSALDYNTGTAEVLRLPEVRDVVTSDFVVLPCDLVCDLSGDKLIQAWMVRSASLTDLLEDKGAAHSTHSGGLGVWYETKTANPVKGEETDFIATTALAPSSTVSPKDSLLSHISELVYAMPTDSLDDLTDEKASFPVRHGLIRKHPRVRMRTSHRDAHMYVFPRWVMDFVKENERLETIGEDVVGWWAKAGWQSGLAQKLGVRRIFRHDNMSEQDGSAKGDGDSQGDADSDGSRAGLASPTVQQLHAAEKMNLRIEDSEAAPPVADLESFPPLLAYVHPPQPGSALIRRVDTAQLLLQVSLQLAKLPSIEETGPEAASPYAHPRKVAYPEGVKPRTTITRPDSLVAENVTVEEKTSIRECVVGANCQIREGAKLSQCLLMEGVVVGKGCKLTRCILGKRCQIGEGSVMTDCEVQEHLLVEPKSDEKDSKLMSSSGLEATEEEIEEVLQEEDAIGLEGPESTSTVL